MSTGGASWEGRTVWWSETEFVDEVNIKFLLSGNTSEQRSIRFLDVWSSTVKNPEHELLIEVWLDLAWLHTGPILLGCRAKLCKYIFICCPCLTLIVYEQWWCMPNPRNNVAFPRMYPCIPLMMTASRLHSSDEITENE